MAPSLREIRRASTKKRKAREEEAPVRKRIATEAARVIEARTASEGSEVRGRDRLPPLAPSPIDLTKASSEREVLAAQAPEAVAPSAPEAVAPLVPEAVPEAGTGSAAPEHNPEATPSKEKEGDEVARAGPSAAASEAHSEAEPAPGTSAGGIDVSFQSILARYTRWAEDTMLDASTPEVQEYLRHQGSQVFFREAAVAQFWALNSWVAMRNLWTQCQAALDQSLEEIQGVKARAEAALEEVRVEVTRAQKAEAEAAAFKARAEEAEDALEVAQRRAANELDNAQVAEEKQREAEEKLKAAELEILSLRDRLHSATIEIGVVKEEAKNAEELVCRSDGEIVVLRATLSETEGRATKAEERATEAEKRIQGAVEDFRKSATYNTELAETTSFAYDGGFKDCKEKIKRIFKLEGIDDIEPDDEEDDAPDSAEP